MRVDILFRSCSRVEALHGGQRVVADSKGTLILACLRSLLRARDAILEERPNVASTVCVVDDASDMDTSAALRYLTGAVVPVNGTGNGASIRTALGLARASEADLVYVVEDDYVHAPCALAEMVVAYEAFRERTNGEVVIHPYDCPDRYAQPYESLVLIGRDRHWRTVRHTTGTFMLAPATLERFWPFYAAFGRYGEPGINEDTTINRVYSAVPCFAPMPALAVHLQGAAQVSPFVDWRPWYDGGPQSGQLV